MFAEALRNGAAAVIETLSAAGMIPVIAPIGVAEDGQTYNVNADTFAGAIAGALKKKLGLNVESEKADDRGRVYRIAE